MILLVLFAAAAVLGLGSFALGARWALRLRERLILAHLRQRREMFSSVIVIDDAWTRGRLSGQRAEIDALEQELVLFGSTLRPPADRRPGPLASV